MSTRQRGFVYYAELDVNKLREIFKKFRTPLYFAWDFAWYRFGCGLPDELGQSGSVFDSEKEIRWSKNKTGQFDILILSESPFDLETGKEVEGIWEVERGYNTMLWDLADRKIDPEIEVYPRLNKNRGWLRCSLFYRYGILTFISPRELLKEGEEKNE